MPQSDVNLSCELLSDAYEDKFDVVFVVSTDSDLTTPVKKAMQLNKVVIIAKSPNRKSYVLEKHATNFFSVNAHRLKSAYDL